MGSSQESSFLLPFRVVSDADPGALGLIGHLSPSLFLPHPLYSPFE
jgi:hypothetical protein